ncbi:TRAP transporter large permease [Ferrovibrio sp.]|uniref:TRAP transporter large permease n=1 Tax=Ferrovibrio sp. TaxID=1917215 RepID=UPI000CCAB94C|nr:TRAP transporter large permease [Ferrovibrio sp.]PJI44369.1 MAG: C4-dicarboxylate ABC transporter permease [Ferrovibrio sp.]
MDQDFVTVAGFVTLFVLMVLRVPVGIAMGIVGVGGFGILAATKPALNLLAQSPIRVATDYDLAVIPMFILMGSFATAAGMSRELFRAAEAWLGHRRGGLAMATVMACAGFAAINGSSVATAATMTKVALPEMRRFGYHPGFSTGVIAAGGTLGIMIPPSVVFALYGILTEQDIGKLFISGVLPGLLAVMLYLVTIQIVGWWKPDMVPRGPKTSWAEKFTSLRDIWATVLLFAGIVGGLYGGVFTATEAAGCGACGALIIGILRGRLGWTEIKDSLVDAVRTGGSIFTIVVGAFLFGYFLVITQTPQRVSDFLTGLPVGPYGVLTLILIMYLILGALMDELAIILVTVPIIFPVMMQLGFDPIWFGVIIVMVTTLGMVMPPVGINVFVINSIARDISLWQIYKGVMPFIVVDLIRLTLLVVFPIIALWLPGHMN